MYDHEINLSIHEGCGNLMVGDFVVIQHLVDRDWIQVAEVKRVRALLSATVATEDMLNSPANWIIRFVL